MAIKKAIKAIAKTLFANPKNYGGKRSLSSIKYIVIHYTANDGDCCYDFFERQIFPQQRG